MLKAEKKIHWGNIGTERAELVLLAAFLIIMLISLFRYTADGEPRTVVSDEGEIAESIALYDGLKCEWSFINTEEMNWQNGHYGLKFSQAAQECGGELRIRVEQGEYCEEAAVKVSKIDSEGFFPLPITLSALPKGQALISVTTEGVKQGELSLACGKDYYAFGRMRVDGEETDYTPAQEYFWHVRDWEYRLRKICYFLVVIGCAALVLLVAGKDGQAKETRGKCLAVFGILMGIFSAMYFVYNSFILMEPTYAEAVTNFLQFAREEKFLANFLITDAGYWPLLPRLITLFYIKVLRIPLEIVLYVMQFTACLFCCAFWSFFVLPPFEGLLRLPLRILSCFLLMISCFYEETLFFTNFSYYGVLLILLFLLSDMDRWSRPLYGLLVLLCALLCLSKGAYVVILPFMAVRMFLFWRETSKRDRIYAFCLMGASFLQLVYSFSGQGDGSSWIRSESDGGLLVYCLKLLCKTCVDATSYVFLFMKRYLSGKSVMLCLLTILMCGLILAGFFCKILRPRLRGEKIQKQWVMVYTLLLFLFAVIAFYCVSIKGIPAQWGMLWEIRSEPYGGKYEIFCVTAVFLLWFVLFSITDGRNRIFWLGGWLAFILLCMRFCTGLQLRGLGDTTVSDARTYAGDIGAGWQQTKALIRREAFFVPVREKFWGYDRNVTVYQLGEETYFEECAGINLGDMEEGYRSSYTVEEGVPFENIIEVWIHRPNRIEESPCRVRLLDGKGEVIQEAEQFTSNRNFRMGFYFSEPINGVKTVQFVNEAGEEVYIDNYICWVSTW